MISPVSLSNSNVSCSGVTLRNTVWPLILMRSNASRASVRIYICSVAVPPLTVVCLNRALTWTDMATPR